MYAGISKERISYYLVMSQKTYTRNGINGLSINMATFKKNGFSGFGIDNVAGVTCNSVKISQYQETMFLNQPLRVRADGQPRIPPGTYKWSVSPADFGTFSEALWAYTHSSCFIFGKTRRRTSPAANRFCNIRGSLPHCISSFRGYPTTHSYLSLHLRHSAKAGNTTSNEPLFTALKTGTGLIEVEYKSALNGTNALSYDMKEITVNGESGVTISFPQGNIVPQYEEIPMDITLKINHPEPVTISVSDPNKALIRTEAGTPNAQVQLENMVVGVPVRMYVQGLAPSAELDDIEIKATGSDLAKETITVTKKDMLNIENVPDADKYLEGGFVCENQDDDNNNNIIDSADLPTTTSNENDLLKVTIFPAQPRALADKVLLSCNLGEQNIKIWKNKKTGGDPISLPYEYTNAELPEDIYIEGITKSDLRGIELQVTAKSGVNEIISDKAKLTVLKVEILEPNNDPITDNNFSFNTNSTGLCSIFGTGTTGIQSENSKLSWSISPINGSALTCEPSNAAGSSILFNYEGLPTSNNDFGKKWISLSYQEFVNINIMQEVEIFFTKNAYNSPNNTIPNWFYYWKDGNVVSDINQFTYGASGYGEFIPPSTLRLGDEAAGEHYPSKYSIGGIVFGGAKGIDCVSEVCAHELYHKWVYDQWQGPWVGEIDTDEDGLPDDYENSISGTDPNKPDTYNVAGIRDYPDYSWYGDQELMAMKAGDGKKGVATKDWSDPGKQSTHTSVW